MSEPTSSETSAETLRRAAEKLRELANAATPGPWGSHSHHRRQEVHSSGDTWLADAGTDVSRQAGANAAYIAALHPGVALAIADWLESVALELDDLPVLMTDRRAMKVARAYLGEA